MGEFIRTWGPSLLSIFINVAYLWYRFGRLEERLIQTNKRVERLERIQDAHLINSIPE